MFYKNNPIFRCVDNISKNYISMIYIYIYIYILDITMLVKMSGFWAIFTKKKWPKPWFLIIMTNFNIYQ